jgi:hypothetical protein
VGLGIAWVGRWPNAQVELRNSRRKPNASSTVRHSNCQFARKGRRSCLLPSLCRNSAPHLRELTANQVEILQLHGDGAIWKADRPRDRVFEDPALIYRKPGRVGERQCVRGDLEGSRRESSPTPYPDRPSASTSVEQCASGSHQPWAVMGRVRAQPTPWPTATRPIGSAWLAGRREWRRSSAG